MKTNKKSTIYTDKHQFNKAIQCQSWDGVANGYRKWYKQIEEKGARKISDRLLELAEIRPGHRVLDIATGYGEPAINAAENVSSSGSVLAIDISSRILELARERAKARGLQNIEFREGGIENTTLPQEYFDAVLCRWGLMHFRDLDKVLRKIFRSLVPKGVFAAATWGKPSEVPILSIPLNKALEIANESLFSTKHKNGVRLINNNNNLSCIGPFSLADPVTLKHYFEEAGFCDVTIKELIITIEINSVQDYIRSIRELNTTIRSIVSNLPIQRQGQIWDDVANEIVRRGYVKMTNFNQGDKTVHHNESSKLGPVRFSNKVICIAGHKYSTGRSGLHNRRLP